MPSTPLRAAAYACQHTVISCCHPESALQCCCTLGSPTCRINVPLPVSVSIPPLPPSPKPLQRDEPQGTDGGATDAEAGSLPSLGPELPNMPMGEDAGNPFLDPALTQ
eukprot:scaffold276581_cov19-Tisochrysis_lutea.AAC.1